MYKKYFAWSFDDGLEQDKRIINILKSYGMGATFHLNSGMYGDRTYEGRIGNLGMTEMPAEKYEKQKLHMLPYVPHFRIPEDEVVQVYEGFEIASHTKGHVNLAKCSEEERYRQIADDAAALSEKFGQEITGFAYPYGAGVSKSREALRKAGIKYARKAIGKGSFCFPADPLEMPLTCWHISKNAMDMVDEFVKAEPAWDDMFFLMFAHGYEFDFGTRESNWVKFERICEKVSTRDDIICCSIGEALEQHGGRK